MLCRTLGLALAVAVGTTGTGFGQTPRLDAATKMNAEAVTHLKAGKAREAIPLLQQVVAIREKDLGPDNTKTADALSNLASAYDGDGDSYAALPLLRRALRTYQTVSPNNPSVPVILGNLAALYYRIDQLPEALGVAERALKLSGDIDGPESPTAVDSMANLAAIHWGMGAHAEARDLLQRAIEINESVQPEGYVGNARLLNNLAAVHQSLGEYAEALPLYQRALEIREKALGPDHPDVRDVLGNIGSLYLLKRDYAMAEKYLSRSQSFDGMMELYLARGQPRIALAAAEVRKLRAGDSPASRIRYHTVRGVALAAVDQRVEAAVALGQAVEEIESLRERATGTRAAFFTAGMEGGYARVYRTLCSVLVEMSLRNESVPPSLASYGPDAASAAFFVAEATKARSLLDTMAGAARRVQDPALPAAIADEETALAAQLAALDATWEQAFQKGSDAWKAHQARRAALRQQLDTLVVRLRRDHPLYAALHYPRPIPVRDVPLKADEVLLEYAIGEESSAVLVARAGRTPAVVRIPLGRDALQAKVKAFMSPLLNIQGTGFSTQLAKELYDQLLAGALAGVAPGTPVLIVPDGILGLVPFEALAVEAGATIERTTWVADRYAVRYYQSATVLALQRQLASGKPTRPLFALGNPVFATGDPRYAAARGATLPAPAPGAAAPATRAASAFTTLATRREWGKTSADDASGEALVYLPLPETATEVKTIAGLFGVPLQPPDVLLDLQANETGLRKAPLGTYRYLHFATHADLPGKVQRVREPFILLGQVDNVGGDDGFLTLSKVLGLKLSADLVVLSACVTGRGAVMEGEGVANFARAFQQAGAGAVVVSLWEVASEPAVEYMSLFYGALHAGQSRAAALRTARDAIKAKYPNPYFWAVFILHGEG